MWPTLRIAARAQRMLHPSWATRAARWGMLLLYLFAASGLPLPVLVVSAAAGDGALAANSGVSACGCSVNDRALGQCCCAKRAGLFGKPACCAVKPAPIRKSPSEPAKPAGSCCATPASEASSCEAPAAVVETAAVERVSVGFILVIEAAKCRGDDVNAGVFLLPHLPTLAATALAAEPMEESSVSSVHYVGRSADPPAPPPRLVVAL